MWEVPCKGTGIVAMVIVAPELPQELAIDGAETFRRSAPLGTKARMIHIDTSNQHHSPAFDNSQRNKSVSKVSIAHDTLEFGLIEPEDSNGRRRISLGCWKAPRSPHSYPPSAAILSNFCYSPRCKHVVFRVYP